MQAEEGMSLQAQRAAIKEHCARHGLHLVSIYEDVASGGKSQRQGLLQALRALHGADVLIVLKFDRLSRSVRHFCELFETHFSDGRKQLIALREQVQLDTALGQALVRLLMVFAELERRATGERVRDSIRFRRRQGYHWGKVPYGKRAMRAPDEPRCKILVEEPVEQAVLERLRREAAAGETARTSAARLNAEQVPAPQGARWTTSTVYGLRRRLGIARVRPHNVRTHNDEQVRERIVLLRARGLIYREIAAELNTEGWLPLKGRAFSEVGVRRLFDRTDVAAVLSPRQFLEGQLQQLEREHAIERPQEPFRRPSSSALARLLTEAGFRTPKGRTHWWPAQVREVLDRRFDAYYPRHSATT